MELLHGGMLRNIQVYLQPQRCDEANCCLWGEYCNFELCQMTRLFSRKCILPENLVLLPKCPFAFTNLRAMLTPECGLYL